MIAREVMQRRSHYFRSRMGNAAMIKSSLHAEVMRVGAPQRRIDRSLHPCR